MTTPTPSQPPNPSSASKKTAAHHSTPSHMNYSSPAPRSIPSPVATRKDQAGRTPINHPTTGSTGSKTLGGTPMLASLSAQGNPSSSSPGTNLLAGFGTPVGLGVGLDGITPGGGPYLPTPSLGGAAMLPTMSELGLKRNEDEERRAKMHKVLKSIGRPKGRVSEEGIARISRRVGFQNDIDAEKLTPEERERKVGNRSISIAGNKLVIDVELKAHVVQGIQVIFDSEDKGLSEVQAPAAAKILMEDLRAPRGIPLTAKLDRFAVNLERLARIDRLSSGQVNCFEALSGVYSSLSRLYEQEKRFADEMEVMCKRSGRPRIHTDDSLGLVIDYWHPQRHIAARSQQDTKSEDRVSKLRIEVESNPGSLIPPLVVSESWLPDSFELTASDAEGNIIPWQEPPPAINQDTGEKMIVDGSIDSTSLNFIARLEPPIIMEYTTAMTLLGSFGVSVPQLASYPPSYHALATDAEASSTAQPQLPASLTKVKELISIDNGQEMNVEHVNTLYPVKSQEYGWKIESLPFSHPRQLIEILPVLRQWSQVGALLRTAFPVEGHSKDQDLTSNPVAIETLLTPPTTPSNAGKISLDMALQCLPSPSLTITYPHPRSDSGSTTAVQILANADLAVNSVNDGNESDAAANEKNKRITTALDRTGDLDIWVEWLRTRP